MPRAQPLSAALDAFNQALTLSGEDVEALERLDWKLKSLHRRHRTDSVSAIARLHVNEMLGRREQAVALADEIWQWRHSIPPSLKLALALMESSIGNYDRAMRLADAASESPLSPELARNHGIVAAEALVSTWDPEFVRDSSASSASYRSFVGELSDANLLEAMPARQLLVNSLVVPFQCGCQVHLGTEGGEGTKLSRLLYVTGDYGARRALSAEISTALSSFYAEHGINEGSAGDLVSEVILPIAARPPLEGDAAKRAA